MPLPFLRPRNDAIRISQKYADHLSIYVLISYVQCPQYDFNIMYHFKTKNHFNEDV